MTTTLLPQRRNFTALESRRFRAGQLFAKGYHQADIVRGLRVSRQTASRWYQAWQRVGDAGLRGAGRAGRNPRLNAAVRDRLEVALVQGPTAWVPHASVDAGAGGAGDLEALPRAPLGAPARSAAGTSSGSSTHGARMSPDE